MDRVVEAMTPFTDDEAVTIWAEAWRVRKMTSTEATEAARGEKCFESLPGDEGPPLVSGRA